jgi:uncharacterized protein (TIGR03437 family)
LIDNSTGGKRSCDADFAAPAAGASVTFFMTGEGAVNPPIADGHLPTSPAPAPVLPLSVWFGGVRAPACDSSSIGLIYPGVTQVNACMPPSVIWTPGTPIAVAGS